MDNKGFTLVELIATLVVLGIVVSIVGISISGVFESAKNKTEDVFVETIKDAMDMYLDGDKTDADGNKLKFTEPCTNKIDKTNGEVEVYVVTTNFQAVINSKYKPITQDELVNPAKKEVECANAKDIDVNIYRDEDFVYYYSIHKSEFKKESEFFLVKEYDVNGNPIYYNFQVISNLPEGFECQ